MRDSRAIVSRYSEVERKNDNPDFPSRQEIQYWENPTVHLYLQVNGWYFPSIGFLVPPPFIFVPQSPSLAAALGSLSLSNRGAQPPSLF